MAGEAVEQSIGAIHADAASLARRAAAAGGTHVALVAGRSVDEWHRALERAGPASPARAYLVSVDNAVRGPAGAVAPAPSGRPIGGGVVIDAVEAPLAEPEAYLRSALAAIGGLDAGGTVVVDDVGALIEADADAGSTVAALVDAAADAGVEFHGAAAGDGAALSALARRLPVVDDEAERVLTERLLAHLRESDPTNFGYLRHHWREARTGLAAVEMSYPQSKQIHASIPDPETTPRTLGAALQALVTLGALDVWGDTVAANRYDLTRYDPSRIDTVGAILADIDG
ncbi:hypothetical protein [Halobaculum gomorrense]|uniref:Uncharacterized protein n=1 Tax=Halobaculum gomorrense TaxID=43928 RepID=A0A1M5U114_9EURY|nr:hypothetical protein [Halobaculum gomorrense]SHH56550.1 hypothetical protein SAMN05443636_2868 [Halobaculum gomorrense]